MSKCLKSKYNLSKAPRPLARLWQRLTRGALLALALVATPLQAADVRAEFAEETTSYAHGVLGDTIEYKALRIFAEGKTRLVRLPGTRVFEDIAPRLWDVTGDGQPEIVVIETNPAVGAQLAIYSSRGEKLAATPHIGQRNRWLAPIGAADFDGDGHIELAYIDRPHLAKTLRIWRFRDGRLSEVTSLKGQTNHKIGWDFIASGFRNCGHRPEMITADANWRSIMATTLEKGRATSRRIAAYTGPKSLQEALSCPR